MTIKEMHKLFRTLSQQVGMEAVRAILPSEIDNLINQSIIGFVRNVLAKNANVQYRDRISIRANTIAPINALRTLYNVVKVGSVRVESQHNNLTIYNVDLNSKDLTVVTDVAVVYSDFNNVPFYCRFIEPEQYHLLRRDFCNAPSYDSPICSIISDDKSTMTFRVETGKGNYVPNEIQFGYIREPRVVSFDDNIDCDLPDHVHREIVTNASKVYLAAISLTSNNIQ